MRRSLLLIALGCLAICPAALAEEPGLGDGETPTNVTPLDTTPTATPEAAPIVEAPTATQLEIKEPTAEVQPLPEEMTVNSSEDTADLNVVSWRTLAAQWEKTTDSIDEMVAHNRAEWPKVQNDVAAIKQSSAALSAQFAGLKEKIIADLRANYIDENHVSSSMGTAPPPANDEFTELMSSAMSLYGVDSETTDMPKECVDDFAARIAACQIAVESDAQTTELRDSFSPVLTEGGAAMFDRMIGELGELQTALGCAELEAEADCLATDSILDQNGFDVDTNSCQVEMSAASNGCFTPDQLAAACTQVDALSANLAQANASIARAFAADELDAATANTNYVGAVLGCE